MEQLKDDTVEFIFACKEARVEFVNEICRQEWNTKLRTNADDILIMYDQLVDRLTRTQQDKQLESIPVINGDKEIIIEELRYACASYYNWYRFENGDGLDIDETATEAFDVWLDTPHGKNVFRMFNNYSARAKQLEKENEQMRNENNRLKEFLKKFNGFDEQLLNK